MSKCPQFGASIMFSGNKFTSVPACVFLLKKSLTRFMMSDNMLTSVPAEVCIIITQLSF